uniref:formin-like protein 21b n=1 Tax=Erigeron canadensis TaxID=72917 RepID=UPI001CB8EEDA|nr:formin-like protein 21b [Erigeron canadensis]
MDIILTKVPMTSPEIVDAILALDERQLSIDLVENIYKCSPTSEEMEKLENYRGDKKLLGKCEQHFLELMKVPRIESKMPVFRFKIGFSNQLAELRKSLNIVNSTCDELRKSVKLKEVMKIILYLGNILNQGTARGAALGFKLDSLLKLTGTRTSGNTMTLMHYLCKVLASDYPTLLDFHKDLVSLQSATKIQLKLLAEDMPYISNGLRKVKLELDASANDGPISKGFHETLKEFTAYAEKEVKTVSELYADAGRNVNGLARYFAESPDRYPFEQVSSTLSEFVRLFKDCDKENRKKAEAARQKAEKEIEMT